MPKDKFSGFNIFVRDWRGRTTYKVTNAEDVCDWMYIRYLPLEGKWDLANGKHFQIIRHIFDTLDPKSRKENHGIFFSYDMEIVELKAQEDGS